MQKSARVFRAITIVLYLAVTAFLLATFLDILLTETNNLQLALAVFFTIFVLVVGGIAFGVITLFSLILGIIYRQRSKKSPERAVSVKWFFTVAILSVVTFFVFFFTTYLLVT